MKFKEICLIIHGHSHNTEMGFNGDEVPVIKGSALAALEDKTPEIGRDTIVELMATVDKELPDPVRDLDKPFLLPGTQSHPNHFPRFARVNRSLACTQLFRKLAHFVLGAS